MTAWIAILISGVALAVSLWTWIKNRQDATKRDHEARVARVNDKLVELSKTTHRASQGSAHDQNAVRPAQRDLATAIAAAHVEFVACWKVADASGVNEILSFEGDAFREVAEYSADLARGADRDW